MYKRQLLVNIEDMAKSAAANRIEEDLESVGLRVTVERLAWEDLSLIHI